MDSWSDILRNQTILMMGVKMMKQIINGVCTNYTKIRNRHRDVGDHNEAIVTTNITLD